MPERYENRMPQAAKEGLPLRWGGKALPTGFAQPQPVPTGTGAHLEVGVEGQGAPAGPADEEESDHHPPISPPPPPVS